MNDDPSPSRSWLERLSHLLHREPQDRGDLVHLLHEAQHRHLMDEDALSMIEGVLKVAEMQVRDIMIPRSQMIIVDINATPEETLPIVVSSAHSRFPVINESLDKILGILLAKDLLRYTAGNNDSAKLRDMVRPAIFIPESKRLNVLLKEFRLNRNHMAIVVDEYGGVAGLVTIEDVLEQIVGNIEDEYDEDDNAEKIKMLNPTQHNVAALTSIEQFNEFFKTQFTDEEFDTIGGLVMSHFGHLPKRGESMLIEDIQFKVLHANKRRIKLLRVTLPKKSKTT